MHSLTLLVCLPTLSKPALCDVTFVLGGFGCLPAQLPFKKHLVEDCNFRNIQPRQLQDLQSSSFRKCQIRPAGDCERLENKRMQNDVNRRKPKLVSVGVLVLVHAICSCSSW